MNMIFLKCVTFLCGSKIVLLW